MKLHVIDTGFFKLDGGAMFGVVPKVLWNKVNPADEDNKCTWAMRCLLVETGDRKILIDTGVGDKQDEKFKRNFGVHGDASLESSLQQAGFSPEDITDVFLTHLHFDHVGGAVKYKDGDPEKPVLTFPNAIYWSHSWHWQWATHPNPREKASFLKENLQPISDSGQLHFMDEQRMMPFEGLSYFCVHGHTDHQMIPVLDYNGQTVVYAADLLPSAGHIPLPYVMSFDVRPLDTMKEKEKFLNNAADNNYVIFLEHDPVNECCTVQHTEKGVRLREAFSWKELSK